jgi:hypothetical protein
MESQKSGVNACGINWLSTEVSEEVPHSPLHSR